MRLRLITGLMLCLVFLAFSAAAADIGQYQKIVVINLAFQTDSVKELSSEIRYGSAPNLNLQSGPITGQLLNSEGKIIDEFSIRDPRIQLGDTVQSDTGQDGQVLNGYSEYLPDAKFSITVPYSSELHSINLINTATGANLILIDLTQPVAAFRQMYPGDPDMQSLSGQPADGQSPFPGIVFVYHRDRSYLRLRSRISHFHKETPANQDSRCG